jgi:hypothetical protein
MEFTIEKNRALQMLKFLNLGEMFPDIILASKNNRIYSSQMQMYGYVFRFAVFEKDYFINVANEDKYPIKVNYKKLYSAINNLTKGQLTFSTNARNLYITSEKGKLTFVTQQIEEGELKEGLIFKMDKGTPIMKPDTDKVRLDTAIKINKSEVEEILKGAEKIEAGFITFKVTKDKIILKLTDALLDDYSFIDFSYELTGEIVNFVKPIEVVCDSVILETISTLQGNPLIQIANGAPIWISNNIPNYYKIGVLIPSFSFEELDPLRVKEDYRKFIPEKEE